MQTVKRALVPAAILAVLLPSCERVWDVTGVWAHHTGKFHYFVLDLRQTGDEITGTACESDAVSLIKGVPVAGEFPRLSAVIGPEHVGQYGESRIGARIVAEVISRDSIGGQLIYPAGHVVPLGFKRSAGAGCVAR